MELLSLILYGAVSLGMVASCLRKRGLFYQFPFWAGTISLGFFFTQATGGFFHVDQFPRDAYAAGMMFATLCMLSLWICFTLAYNRRPTGQSWLTAEFNARRLFYIGAFFSVAGIYFHWKLWSLPTDLLSESQWSGATVKLNFFAGLFKMGLVTMWLLYLDQRKLLNVRLLVFIVPCLCLLVGAAFLRGRRADMMNLFSYVFVGVWLVRRISVPRWVLLAGLTGGLILVNGVEIYRDIMMNKDKPLTERLTEAGKADYVSASTGSMHESSIEFRNYIASRYICATHHMRDYGLWHWNKLVHNYVPAQLLGAEFKKSLIVYGDLYEEMDYLVKFELGHVATTGSTSTGFLDAYLSFGWFGFVKFGLIGWIMGVLYRRAMEGLFLSQLLYVTMLSDAMHAITHHTNLILSASWVYFLLIIYPFLYIAKHRVAREPIFTDPAPIPYDGESHE